MEEKILVDKKGYQQLLDEIDKIELELVSIGKEKGEATDDAGNSTHDNFSYEQAKVQEEMAIVRLGKARERLKRAIIIEKINDPNIVDIDDYVKVELNIFGDIEEDIIKLVGGTPVSDELDFTEASLNSPLGMAIYKKRIGDNFSYSVRDNIINGKIIEKVDSI